MRLLTLFSCFAIALASYKDTDLITNLPGLTYNLNFKHYSGYLKASDGNNLHYWLVESQSSPQNDPLILWLNGGPGCSSLGGLFTELGPFRPNPDGTTLFENIYSWNKQANVLFMEAPRDVGFSYRNTSYPKDTLYNDDKTAMDNYLALKDFFANYKEYAQRPFYVMGESYGGIYVPTLTSLLIKEIQAGRFPDANLVGMAVGNGELSEYLQINSAVDLLYAHGIYGKMEFDQLKACCPGTLLYCDFSQYIILQDDGTAVAKDNSTCAKLVEQMGFDRVWITQNDVYNLYQDCYGDLGTPPLAQQARASSTGFVDQGNLMNWVSSDAFGAFPCYMSDATQKYLNQQNVRDALHIPRMLATRWSDCNYDVNQNYKQQNHDTMPVFTAMVNSGYNLRILIYNGDADTVCNFLGDEWFIEALVKQYNMQTTVTRRPWLFNTQTYAGYRKAWAYNNIKIDLVTVKGAGHFVPTDRPGPALQMITNFIKNQNYSLPTGYSVARAPLLPPYQNGGQTPPPTTTTTTMPITTTTAGSNGGGNGSSNAVFASFTVIVCALLAVVSFASWDKM